jgi:hypothetical protein
MVRNENRLKWLLIFDNADEINEVDGTLSIVHIIPRGQHGCVLTTSRNRASDGELAIKGCEIKEMTEIEAIELLLKCSRRQGSEPDEHSARELSSSNSRQFSPRNRTSRKLHSNHRDFFP